MAAPAKSTPKDAQVMAAILKDMGVNEYEPRLVNQMLEFTYREYFMWYHGISFQTHLISPSLFTVSLSVLSQEGVPGAT